MDTSSVARGIRGLEIVLFLILGTELSGCSGAARELTTGTSLGPPVIGDDGSRSDGNDFGQIYTVTKVVEGTSDIPEWTDADLPFSGPRRQLGQNFTDSQWPFKFTYSYPPNNYKLNEAHVVIVTKRDSSDTEGIFVDGVMTGRPPSGMVSTTSTKVTNRHYICSGTCSGGIAASTPSNTYFIDFSLAHYKIGMMNSFDLNLLDLLAPTALKPVDVANDGVIRVVTGDDSYVDSGSSVEKPLLFLEGFTVSKTALSCTPSPTYHFANTYVHNDGNTISQAAFSGTVLPPATSWTTANSSFRSVEFYFDPKLPKISDLSRLTVSKAEIQLQFKRAASGTAALVVNGVGVAEVGFDTTQATSAVESWDASTATVNAWTAFVATLPADNTAQTKTLDLVSIFGATKVRDMLAQGKLNIAVAGSMATAYGQALTSTRAFGTAVAGPELVLEGSYTTEVCAVPDDPSSPISDSSGTVGSCALDQTSPVASSVQVVSITSTSATIQWLTNEVADSQVGYGITGPSTMTTLDSTLNTFHSVSLTGLSPYKYYQYAVKTRDGCGNLTITGTRTFRTLR